MRFYLAQVNDEQTFFIGDENDFDEEIRLTRQNQALMEFLDRRGTKAKEKRGQSIETVRAQLGL